MAGCRMPAAAEIAGSVVFLYNSDSDRLIPRAAADEAARRHFVSLHGPTRRISLPFALLFSLPLSLLEIGMQLTLAQVALLFSISYCCVCVLPLALCVVRRAWPAERN